MSNQISAMREQGVRIAAAFIDDGYIVFENGLVLPINGFYDDDDNEVDNCYEASYYEAGDEEHGFVTCPMPEPETLLEKSWFH